MRGFRFRGGKTAGHAAVATARILVSLSFLVLFGAGSMNAQQQQQVQPKDVFVDEKLGHSNDKDVGYGAETSFLTWHGYLNFEYQKKMGVPSTFDNHEFYLSTKATLSEKTSITAEFEYEHNPGTLVLPIQAFADYSFSKTLNIRTGLFFSPIGIPRTYTLRGTAIV